MSPNKNDDPGKRRRDLYNKDKDKNPANTTDRLSQLMEQARPMIERVNTLYNQYKGGGLERPPLQERKTLDQLIQSIDVLPKPTQSLMFQYSSIQSRYATYRDKWDKLMKDLETGKIVRVQTSKKKHL